ncbi:MAG: winged helix-turn-helix transcriptional regulator [Clostridia bacterium]
MKKEALLLKMMENVGRGRRGENKHKKSHKDLKQAENKEEKKEHHRKMSPVAENILILLYREGSMNQRKIAQRTNVTGQAVSELMKKFCEHGLIIRESGDLNNENIISLTEKGLEYGKKCEEKISKLADRLFRNFTEEDLDNLAVLLDKMEYEEDLS